MSYLYPYGDTQQLNLSWFLAKFKELYEYIMNLDPDDIALASVLSRFTNEYNNRTNYIPGDYVIHEGFIYKANQSTTGDFNPQAWDAALPVNDIQGLRILLGGVSNDLTDLEQNAVTNLQYTPRAATADGLLRQTKNGAAETVMTVDKEPTENSQNPVKSGAVRAELNAISDAVTDEQTARENADKSLQDQIDDLNDITGDGSLSGFTATDLTGAANELKGSLNSNESALAIVANGNTHAAIAKGQYVYIKGHSTLAEGLYKAIATIPLNGTLSTSNVSAVSNGGFNDINLLNTAELNYSNLQIISGISRLNGGYYKFGRLVVINLVLQVGSADVNIGGKALVDMLPPASDDYGNHAQIGAVTVGGIGLSIPSTALCMITYSGSTLIYGDHTQTLIIPANTSFSISAVYVANK